MYSTRLGDNTGNPRLSPAARNTVYKDIIMVNRPRPLSGELATADDDIARFEFSRSRAHQTGNPGWEEMGIAYSHDDAEAHWDLVERGEVATELFLNDPTARTATLGILRLHGDWEAGERIQQQVIGPDSPLRAEPFNGVEIDKTDPDAERLITIDWGVVGIGGMAMVLARRRIMRTAWVTQELVSHDKKRRYRATSSIEIDKRAGFALDIERLAAIDPEAAREARLIIICGMIASRDLARLKRAVTGTNDEIADYSETGRLPLGQEAASILYARHKMKEYKIPVDEVMQRAFNSDDPARVRGAATLAAIEAEIARPKGLLLPSTVNFYGERTLHRLERV